MCVGVKNLKKDIEDGVHWVLAQAGEKWVNYLEQYSDVVEQLIKLTPNIAILNHYHDCDTIICNTRS